MQSWAGKQYDKVVGYAIGQYYEKRKKDISDLIRLDYLCDRKWEEVPDEYDGISVIHVSELGQLDNSLVVVFTGTAWLYESIKKDLEAMQIDYIHVDDIIGNQQTLTGQFLRENYRDGVYRDSYNNCIYFDKTVPEHLSITFQGSNNSLRLGKNILISSLFISFGNNGICTIGDNTEIIGANFCVSDSKIEIGSDCLFSTQIVLRTHDSHHIFSLDTYERINYPRDIVVGDNVWIGYRVMLLGGAVIGTGSVVGTGSITSSQFGDHRIIAGVPARVIREKICWSRDNTGYFNHAFFDECISKDALKYL